MRQYRQLRGNDIVKELVEEIASTLISTSAGLRFQYQTVPVQVAAKIIREVSMKIQPDMTPFSYSILLLLHPLARL